MDRQHFLNHVSCSCMTIFYFSFRSVVKVIGGKNYRSKKYLQLINLNADFFVVRVFSYEFSSAANIIKVRTDNKYDQHTGYVDCRACHFNGWKRKVWEPVLQEKVHKTISRNVHG